MNSEPVVSVYSPAPNQVFQVGDTIWVEADLKDADGITSVSLKLLDENGISVIQSPTLRTAGTAVEYREALILSDRKMRGGNYSVRLDVSDGTSVARKAVQVIIIPVPLELNSVMVMASGPALTSIYKVFPNLSGFENWYSMQGNSNAMVTDSRLDLLFRAGREGANDIGFDLHTRSILYQNKPLSMLEGARSLDQDHAGILAGSNKGEISLFEGHSYLKLLASSVNQYPVTCLEGAADYIHSIQQPPGPVNNILVTYNRNGGADVLTLPVSFEVRSLLKLNENDLFVLGNAGKDAQVELLRMDGQVFQKLYEIPDTEIHDAAGSGDRIFLATSAGIYSFSYPGGTLFKLSTSAATSLVYDQAGSQLVIAYEKQIKRIDPFTGSVLSILELPDSISGVALWYNREP